MSRRLPPLNALRAFEAAARHLSFTKAARELFVTQAAISHQIKALEEYLCIKLFRRRNRTLLLTEEGQSYFFEIKDIFSQLAEATNKVLERGAKGALTICLPTSFAIQWLVPRLADFNHLHPEIDVRIKAVDLNEGFLSDDADVAIYYGRAPWPGLRCDMLYPEFLLPVCSPATLKGDKPLATLSDLKYHTLLHDSSRSDWKAYAKHYHITDINLNVGPIFSHTAMVLQAAALGHGIALSNNVLAQPELESGRLVCPFEHFLISQNAYYLVTQQKESDSLKIAAFRDWALAKAATEQEQLQPDA